jgi:hypothetical protein
MLEQKIDLITILKSIPDPRRQAGCRHELWVCLLLVIMTMLTGQYGFRPTGSFIRQHYEDLLRYLPLRKARLPSFDTIRRCLQVVDFSELTKAFLQWSRQYIELVESEWIAGDGKALKGTMQDYLQAEQRFVSLVSFFTQHSHQLLESMAFNNKDTSEISVVEQLINRLDLGGYVISLDAVHCQKKLPNK